MQGELRAENPNMPIQILGVNEFGHESGNSAMTDGRTAPVLQDVDANNNGASDVWSDQWDVTFRDVKILNQQNEIVGTVNLTPPAGFDLGEEANYDALKKIIADVAHERPFWQNPRDPTDVNDDGMTTAVDALQCINEMDLGRITGTELELPLPMPPFMPKPFLDVNGDGLIKAIDALRVINRLIEQSGTSEGESIGAEGEALVLVNLPTPIESTAAQPTAPQTLSQASDDADECPLADHGVDTEGSLPVPRPESTVQSGGASNAGSSALTGDAVDSVFGGDDDPLLADPISASLI